MDSVIAENHAYWRNVWLWTCFSLGTYNAVYYYGESIYTTSFTLCLLPPLFISYLAWDTYSMLSYRQLYRSDLLAHHIVCICVYVYSSYCNIWYTMSSMVVNENLSLFNYWLTPPYLLKYKLLILLFYRIPFWIKLITLSFVNDACSYHFFLFTFGPSLFVGYDLFMVKKIIQNPILFRQLHISS
jgi:hypothetical protein